MTQRRDAAPRAAGSEPAAAESRGSESAAPESRGSESAAPESRGSESAAPDSSTLDPPASGDAWWVYCVLSAADTDRVPPELEGIEAGTSIEVVCEGPLGALVSAVPAEDYDDVHLREHLEDLAWVERTARRHEDALEETLRRATIVPLRLCTLYRDLGGVRRLLREHAQQLLDSLRKVDGCAEWGVKVFARSPEATDLTAEQDSESPGAGSGAAYLMARRRERDRAEEVAKLRARCAEAVHERISGCGRESISNPPQRPELHGRDMTMLLNGAYLVAIERTDELHQAIDSLQAEWGPRGFVIELTGPWPAYNFVSGAAGVMR